MAQQDHGTAPNSLSLQGICQNEVLTRQMAWWADAAPFTVPKLPAALQPQPAELTLAHVIE